MRSTATALLLLPALLLACHDEPVAPDAGVVGPPSFATAAGVTITNLNLSGSGHDSRAEDINGSGRIAGWRGPWSGPNRAFVWIPATARGTVGTATNLAGSAAMAHTVNAQGYIAGETGTAGVDLQNPVLWRPLTGGGYSAPLSLGSAVNDGGTVYDLGDFNASNVALAVGASDTRFNPRAIAWSLTRAASGAVTVSTRWQLPGLVAGQGSSAFELNRLGRAVGYANRSSTQNRPVRWTYSGGAWTVLELPMFTGATGGVARGINASGQIVGFDFMGGGRCERAFVWTPPIGTAGAKLRQLPSLGRSLCEVAYGINDARQVAGASNGHAVLWTVGANGEPISLRDLGKLTGTQRDEGLALSELLGGVTEVVGYGITAAGAERGALWTVR
jgi:uncharacterized membrane protein